MAWEVEATDEFVVWFEALGARDQDLIDGAVEKLEERGPLLGRPFVDNVHQSQFRTMKELIPVGSAVRVLFSFDPRRMAILLLGGDKTGLWNNWYGVMVPKADRLYREHLETLRKEGLI